MAALLAVAAAGNGRGQPAAQPPAPLLAERATAPVEGMALQLEAAERAHELGLLSQAADIYRELLAAPGADARSVALALATVLLDANRAAEAEPVLAAIPEPHGPEWQLRNGLAALQLRKRPLAQASFDAIDPAGLPEDELPWYWFLEAALWDTAEAGDFRRANELYRKAEEAAPTLLARARFQLAGEEVRLRLMGDSGGEPIEQIRRNYEQWQGRTQGYEFARQYAVKLNLRGRSAEATEFLAREVLLGLPPQERGWRDEFNLLLGLIADRGKNPVGRAALTQLLQSGSKPERQRQALHLLAEASGAEPARGQFRALLNGLINAQPAHPIRDSLLFYRAELALGEKNFAQAEDDANTFVRDFPGSPLRVHAFGVLTQSAWEQRRYLLAAENARKAREALASAAGSGPLVSRARLNLGVLEAEASFRAGMQAERTEMSAGAGRVYYRNSADAYAAVLRDRPADLGGRDAGDLMYQWVLAEIRSGSGGAAKLIDELAADAAFDLDSRWQAEWSLARGLQIQGKSGEAYARLNQLLETATPAAAGLKPELRARMAWLQARLAYDVRQFAQTLALVDRLLGTLGEVVPELKAQIASTAILLRARAEFGLEREAAALETLQRLRAEYGGTDAALHSYLIEAAHYEAQGKLHEAQLRLTGLTDSAGGRKSDLVPFALFELARLSEQLGQLQEANRRIEQLVMDPAAAGHDLIFAARLKQGDLFRKLNQFPQAQQAYEYLVNTYPQRPDVVYAQLALAECHNAQSSSDPAHAEVAQSKFGELRDRVDAPLDVRVEAGYNLGALLARRGRLDEAARVWWRDVVQSFLIDETRVIEPDAKRRYWLARTLLSLGELLEQQGKLEEAKAAYTVLREKKLGYGEGLARAGLQRLGVPVGQ